MKQHTVSILAIAACGILGRGQLHAVDAVNEKEVTNSIGMKLVRIAPGKFRMGQDGPLSQYNIKKDPAKFDDADWDEAPAHEAILTRPFHLGTTEVTLGQYRQFKPGFGKGGDDEAVTGITWADAKEFCTWLSEKEGATYRLPTEAEWEYACRAGTTTLFHTGDALPAEFHRWIKDAGGRSFIFPHGKLPPEYAPVEGKARFTVGKTPPNAWGLYDMHGNVAEWCEDWYGPYESAEQTDPLGRVDGDFRVIRGGSQSVQTRLLRSANRGGWLPDTRSEKTGFRVVLGELPPGKPLPLATPALNAANVSQSSPKIERSRADIPFFSGPKPFVKIPPDSYGPLFTRHNHSPAIAECPNGDLLAVWYSCVNEPGMELNNLASRLRLGAQEWEPASLFWDGPDVNDHGPKLWWDGDRTLYFFSRGQNENIIRTSTDNGATWSKAQITQPVCEWGNAPIRTKEGHLVITTDVPSTSFNISRDGGKTWTYPVIEEKAKQSRTGSGARHVGIHAPIIQLADGRLMTVGRQDDANHQARYEGKTPVSFTSDWGKTWTYDTIDFPAISTVQRPVLMRLREGPILFCSYTDQIRGWKDRKGMKFKNSTGGEFTGFGLFAALSYDEGKTWPVRRLITQGGVKRTLNTIDRGMFEMSDTMAEPQGYLAATQTRDDKIQLITSKNHYVFNLAWLKALPAVSAD
jgi:sulfatase modifying factor 1